MATIPNQHLDRLRAAGLVIGCTFGPNHISFPDGVTVGKVRSVIPMAGPNGESDDLIALGPMLFFHHDDAKWIVTHWDYVPGSGPGDFINIWNTPEEAVADILGYFESPERISSRARPNF